MFNYLHFHKEKGFTAVEFIVVLAILIILFGTSVAFYISLSKKPDLDGTAQEIAIVLRYARSKALASEELSQYGVYFDNTTSPHQYVLFEGYNYSERDPSFDKIHTFPKKIEIYEINLDGEKEVVFNRMYYNKSLGEAIPPGNIRVRIIDEPARISSVYIEPSGKINFGESLPTLTGLIRDSRHVHFDLGWIIQNATSLKFYFPTVPQTETVDMTPYFDFEGDFYWTGKFSVGGTDQIFKIHNITSDPFPLNNLCIHRDRNNGENNQEVIIYIVDEGEDKEIAHYFNDVYIEPNSSDPAVVKGSSVLGSMQIQ